MARRSEPQALRQVSVGIDDVLREQLEHAAKRSVRSLSGEIIFRLRSTFEPDDEHGSRAADAA